MGERTLEFLFDQRPAEDAGDAEDDATGARGAAWERVLWGEGAAWRRVFDGSVVPEPTAEPGRGGIMGRLTAGSLARVLGGEALPPVEAVAQRTFFDYRAKYEKETGTAYVVDPPELPAALKVELRRLALAAHEVLGCSDFSRTDFRYDPQTKRLAILETNTIPGLTPTSLLPMAAGAVGIDFGALVERFCTLALRARA